MDSELNETHFENAAKPHCVKKRFSALGKCQLHFKSA